MGGKALLDSFQLVPCYNYRKASHGVLPQGWQRLQGAGEPQRLPTGVGHLHNKHYSDWWAKLRVCERHDDASFLQKASGGRHYNLRP